MTVEQLIEILSDVEDKSRVIQVPSVEHGLSDVKSVSHDSGVSPISILGE